MHNPGCERSLLVVWGVFFVVITMGHWSNAWISVGQRRVTCSPGRCTRRSVSFRFFSNANENNDNFKETPKLWKGASHSGSEFVTHVIAGPDQPTVAQAIGNYLPTKETSETSTELGLDNSNITPSNLLMLGSVWFLPHTAPRDPALGAKPTRLKFEDRTRVLEEGDYLRVHHSPRRFPMVHNYDWGVQPRDISKTPVVVASDLNKGYVVVDKPAGVPVHCTVDNFLENVAECLKTSMKQNATGENEIYVSMPQRLDQNTSGLLVAATKKVFASYFAKLLRNKTGKQLESAGGSHGAIHKKYRCLVCLVPQEDDPTWSVVNAIDSLKEYNKTIMRHYLEPSIRAPKNFARIPGNETWAESLLRITRIGEVCPLVGSEAGQELAISLWSDLANMPEGCAAVVELEIELLTGRTHQIRGQLSTEGYPLVGDAQYGGAISDRKRSTESMSSIGYVDSDRLALQCCELKFLDPDVTTSRKDGTEVGKMSDRWNTFRVDEAWWTPVIHTYRKRSSESSSEQATTSDADADHVRALTEIMAVDHREAGVDISDKDARLPPSVLLSPGVHKYVVIEAKHPNENECCWFVKSASPAECGGVYHANVAQSLVEDLTNLGLEVTITGGGRIDYNEYAPHAHVYGFSYGFGKGDHARVASLIEKYSNNTIIATYDNSDTLY